MLSLRCRINANVAELLVIIGYSELSDLRSELVRPLSAARTAVLPPSLPPSHPPTRPPAAPLSHPCLCLYTPRVSLLSSSPVWSFSGLSCLVAATRTGALLGGPGGFPDSPECVRPAISHPAQSRGRGTRAGEHPRNRISGKGDCRAGVIETNFGAVRCSIRNIRDTRTYVIGNRARPLSSCSSSSTSSLWYFRFN